MSSRYPQPQGNRQAGNKGFTKTQKVFVPKSQDQNQSPKSPIPNPTLSGSLRQSVAVTSSVATASRVRMGERGEYVSTKGNFVNYLPQDEAVAAGLGADEGGLDALESQRVVDRSIVSIHVDSDIMSLDGRQPLETEAEIKEDGKLHVTVRKSNASRSDIYSRRSHSQGLSSNTPRPSNLTNAEIYSLQSSRNPTPRGSSFNHTDFYSMMAAGRNSNFGSSDVFGGPLTASRGPTPRPSNYEDDGGAAVGAATAGNKPRFHYQGGGNNPTTHYPAPNPGMFSPTTAASKNVVAPANPKRSNGNGPNGPAQDGGRDRSLPWFSVNL